MAPGPTPEEEPPHPELSPSPRPAGPRDADRDASRSTAPHRPSGRQLDGLPRGGARTSMRTCLNADHSGAR